MRAVLLPWALAATGLNGCVDGSLGSKDSDSQEDTALGPGDSTESSGWMAVEVNAAREACGLTLDGRVLCWGEVPPDEPPPGSGGWSELSFFSAVGCVADALGTVECWWHQHNEWVNEPLRTPPEEPLHHISVGAYIGCGFTELGDLLCWGEPSWGDWTPPEGEWRSVDVGGDVACAIGAEGGLECWGSKAFHDVSAKYVSVSVGFTHIVALDERGVVHCFPQFMFDTCDVPEDLHLRMVDAGNQATCGITTDGDVVCWASERGHGKFDAVPEGVQPGPWVDVAVGRAGACAVRETGEMVCFVGEGGYLSNIPDPG